MATHYHCQPAIQWILEVLCVISCWLLTIRCELKDAEMDCETVTGGHSQKNIINICITSCKNVKIQEKDE